MVNSRFPRFRKLAAVLAFFVIFTSGMTVAGNPSGEGRGLGPGYNETAGYAADAGGIDAKSDPWRTGDVPPPFPHLTPGTYTVTLITGHRVHVDVNDDGTVAAHVDPGEGETPQVFRTVESDGGFYVIPGEADGLIPHVLDDRLFNITYLIAHGYHDGLQSSIPVIVTGDPAGAPGDLTFLQRKLPGFSESKAFTSIPAAAGRFDKGSHLAALTDALASDAAGTAGAGVQKIWLDGKVSAALEHSVPGVGAPGAWQSGFDGTGVTVAVLDTGIDAQHPDLVGQVVMAENFTDDSEAGDRHGHGTHVAGTVAGTGAASGGLRKGVAPGARLIDGKVLGDDGVGRASWAIAGMEWAAANADIVNLSLGTGPTDGTDPMSMALNNLTEQHDVLFVVAAGNRGPRPYSIGSPGAADKALTVGNVLNEGGLNRMSSRGPRLGDHAIKPEITAPGTDITSARAADTALGPVVDEHYTRLSGTSMAAPHVAGAAALLLQKEPGAGAARLKAALAAGAVPEAGLTVYQQGSGRLDVGRALAARVIPDKVTLDIGFFPYGDDVPEPATAVLVYSNTGEDDVTLSLTIDMNDENDDLVPPGAVVLSTGQLTVPGGGEAAVQVTVYGDAVGYGLYGGYLTASGPDGLEVHTPVGFYKEGEMVDLTVTGIARDGRPADGTSRVEVMNVDDWDAFNDSVQFADGVAHFRVPPGTYSVNSFIHTYNAAGTKFTEIAYAGEPEIEITADTTIAFDVTGASKIEVITPHLAETSHAALGYGRHDVRGNRRHFVVHAMNIGDNLYTMPTAPITKGFFEVYSSRVMAAPLIHMATTSPPGMGLDVAYLRGSPFFDGQVEAGLVFAGIGRPGDFEGVDAEGKIVLMELGAIAPAEKARNAAAAGAVAAVIHRDKPGKYSASLGGEGIIPTLALSMEEGLELRSMLGEGDVFVGMSGAPVSPYIYDLVLPEPGGIDGDLVYVVGENAPVAALDVTYNADEEGLQQTMIRQYWRPYSILSFSYGRHHHAPLTRREYVSAGDTRFRQKVYYRRDFMAAQQELSRPYPEEYEGGTTWWKPAVSPSFMEGGPWDYPQPTQRSRDTLYFHVAEASDGTSGHWGTMDEANDTAHLRFYRDGQLVGTGSSGRETFAMVPEEAEYRVELDWSRTLDGWHTSPQVNTAWTFMSEYAPRSEVLPLLVAEYDLTADSTNRLLSNNIGLLVRHQEGSAGAPITDVQLEASFDDGSSWVPAVLQAGGEGRFTAWLPIPEEEPDYVSLRIDASDEAGGRLQQTIVRVVGWAVEGEAEGPELVVLEPADGLYTNGTTVMAAGTAADPRGGPVAVTVAGYEAEVSEDGSFAIVIPLPEEDGPFEIPFTAHSAGGGATEDIRTVNVDRTPPIIDEGSIEPAADVVLAWGESVTVRFTGEPGLTASYRVMVPGGSGGLRPVLPVLAPMTEIGEGIYEGIYTAPTGTVFADVPVEIHAADMAGNTIRSSVPGRITVVEEREPEPAPVEPPSLVITEPADGFLTNRDSVKVVGIASDEQEGQEIAEVTVDGRVVDVAGDGTFSTRIMLEEGPNTITVTAQNTAGKSAVKSVTVYADSTPPELSEMEPAEHVFLFPGQTATFRFVSEPGLTAAFQVVVGGRRGTWYGRDLPIQGTPMMEVFPGVYEGTYYVLPRMPINRAIIQFNASDPAGNVIMTTAPGEVTVLGGLPIM